MPTLDGLIYEAAEILHRHNLNTEVALFYSRSSPGGLFTLEEWNLPWQVEACNESEHVMLGEVSGKYHAYGYTAEKAVAQLVEKMLADLEPTPTSENAR